MPDPIGAVVAVRRVIPANVPVVVIGGLAANVYRAVERFTQDADLVVYVDASAATAMDRALVKAGFTKPRGRRTYRSGAIGWRKFLWPFPDPMQPTVVDLFFGGEADRITPFLAAVASRAAVRRVGDVHVGVAAPEDIVLFKLMAIASGKRGSQAIIDEDDVRQILWNRSHHIDAEYVRSWAVALGVQKLAVKYLREVGL